MREEGRAGSIRERVRADGTVYYQARYWDTNDHGSVQRSKSFPSQDKAEDFLRGVSRRKRDHTYQAPSPRTVSDLVHEYIERAVSRVSTNTTHTNRHRLKTMIESTIGKKKLEGLTTLDVQRWIDALNRSKYRPSTIGSAITLVMAALREAATLGITDRHQGVGVRRPSNGKAKIQVWSEEQVRRVLNHIRSDPIYGALYHVALATGMRPGELRALHWDDVNLGAGVIHVRRTITRAEHGPDFIASGTKTSAGRAVAISPETVDLLKWHRRQQRERQLAHASWHDLKIVFDRGDGRWLNAPTWHLAQTRICTAVGVPRIRLHDLRHTFATIMMSKNVHPKIVSDILGHASINLTLDLYTHTNESMQRTAIESLADLFADHG